ncbi:MAG: SH3 domain-containing protein [Lachnospiraceae bacterium]|nr:SH3 domain-containing protein [Lachnospiraceae bacterium]
MSLLDKKSRTSIMYGVIICLSIAIIFCVVKIATRPAVVKEDTNYYLPVKEKVDMEEIQMQVKEKEESQDKVVQLDIHNRARLIEDNVNIRSGPGTDYERLGSAYKGYDFKIISGETSEWIKIEYDGKPAYVYAEYVEIVPMFLNDLGVYEEYVELDNSSNDASALESEETENNENSEESSED